jgi:dolichol-phosphate mannosyltransferase
MKKTLLILPAYNEEGKIGTLVKKAIASNTVTTVLVSTDGNTDNTASEAKNAGAVVLSSPEKRGVGFAIRRGIDYALENGYEYCVIMGGDDQDDPKEIPKLLAKLDESNDFVIGSRYISGGKTENQNAFRFFSTKIYSLFFSTMALRWLSDASNGFRAFKTSACKNIDLWRPDLDHYELEPFFLYDMVTKHKWAEVPVKKYYHQDKSYSKMKINDFFVILVPVVKKRLGLY